MGDVIQFPGKGPPKPSPKPPPKPKAKPPRKDTPTKEIIISCNTYVDFTAAWAIVKELRKVMPVPNRKGLTQYQREILAAADLLPVTPGYRKEPD